MRIRLERHPRCFPAAASLVALAALLATLAAASVRAEERPRLLVLCVDGLRAEVFERLLAEGRLPAIARLAARHPAVLGRALASFPSSTAPSVPEFLTGRYADRTVAMPRAIHAFDRESETARRYSLEPAAWQDDTPTLFTLLDSRSETSYSLFEGHFGGSVSFSSRTELIWGGIVEALRLPVYNPDRSLLKRFRRMVEVRGVPPRAAFLVFNSVDLAGHLRSPESKRYEDALVELDGLLQEELLDWMARYPLPGGGTYLDDTTFAIFGDHGMESSERFVDLRETLRPEGLKVVDLGTVFQVAIREKLSPNWAERPDVVLAPGGSNVTQVYLRRPDGTWGDGPAGPPETERVARLLARAPGVEFVIRRLGPDRLELRADGLRTAVLVQRGNGEGRRFAYLVGPGRGGDPLGYLASPGAAALASVGEGPIDGPIPTDAFHSMREWHLATEETRYPAAVPLLLKGCASGPTQGDLVLTSAPGWSFLRHTRGDHGGLRKDSIETSLLLVGPRIRKDASLAGSRLIDLLPTFLDLLGFEADPSFLASLDGRDLGVSLPGEPSRGFIPPLRAAAARTGPGPGPVALAGPARPVGAWGSEIRASVP